MKDTIKKKRPVWLSKFIFLLSILGPGLITASADNDAPGIATYSVAGATYGYKLIWVILVITIGEVVILEMAARMGAVTGKGTADLIRERFGVKISTLAMLLLIVANLATTVAQFAGVAAAGELFGISRYISVPIAAVVMTFIVLKAEYKYVERVLLVLCLASLSYVVAVFTVKPDWAAIGQAIIRPQIELSGDFLVTMLAVIGTTITPWAIYYLQASVADRGVDMKEYRYTRLDVSFGSAWGNVISAFILIVTAATLYVNGVAVNDAKDAALALQPLAGEASSILFSVGLLGASLLAVSVLPLSTTYAFCEAYGFERGLNRKVKEAPVFYGMLIAIMAISSLVVLIPNAPLFQMMILSQTLNAMLLPVLLILVLKLANSKEIMGKYTNSKLTNILAIGITLLIVVVTIALFFEPLLNKIF
ncbi:MAG TPA: Nramp family divalent metal transporter [Anaerolineaceae bacterium]|jgi:Mn2+/Fe2+ NRAMP family transporter|nr:Nramp family divalent metal transporter [Anaerolineaceae bacterium]HOH92291.1 Nramp family divalent metal transporter [Anaerolineaceae bacterium]HQL92578.1 Nramp family divalent metal transporter [Anaerolineaceae bacterium]